MTKAELALTRGGEFFIIYLMVSKNITRTSSTEMVPNVNNIIPYMLIAETTKE